MLVSSLCLRKQLFVANIVSLAGPARSSAPCFRPRHAVPARGNSPSVLEGVPEGRGSNMSIRVPCERQRPEGHGRRPTLAFGHPFPRERELGFGRCCSQWPRIVFLRPTLLRHTICFGPHLGNLLLLTRPKLSTTSRSGSGFFLYFCPPILSFSNQLGELLFLRQRYKILQLPICQIFILFFDNFG